MPTNRTPKRGRTPKQDRTEYRDAAGHALSDYPRPSLAVDTAVLTVAPRPKPTPDRPALQLLVLLVRRPPDAGEPVWALPGTFLHQRERLADAVTRSLADKAGIIARPPTTQLGVFDDPDRDARGWVITVGHLAAIAHHHLGDALDARPDQIRLAPASRPGRLPYDHAAILTTALTQLRQLYRRRPDPLHLLGTTFTITQLRQVHEAVHGDHLQKDTFRRAMEPLLRPTDTLTTGSIGRPSQVFHRSR